MQNSVTIFNLTRTVSGENVNVKNQVEGYIKDLIPAFVFLFATNEDLKNLIELSLKLYKDIEPTSKELKKCYVNEDNFKKDIHLLIELAVKSAIIELEKQKFSNN